MKQRLLYWREEEIIVIRGDKIVLLPKKQKEKNKKQKEKNKKENKNKETNKQTNKETKKQTNKRIWCIK